MARRASICGGVSGAVDLDYSYTDFLPLIQAGNFSGYGAAGPSMQAVSGYTLSVFGANNEYFYSANFNDVVGYLPVGSYPVLKMSAGPYLGYDWVLLRCQGGEYWTALLNDRNRLESGAAGDPGAESCTAALAAAQAKISAAKTALE